MVKRPTAARADDGQTINKTKTARSTGGGQPSREEDDFMTVTRKRKQRPKLKSGSKESADIGLDFAPVRWLGPWFYGIDGPAKGTTAEELWTNTPAVG